MSYEKIRLAGDILGVTLFISSGVYTVYHCIRNATQARKGSGKKLNEVLVFFLFVIATFSLSYLLSRIIKV